MKYLVMILTTLGVFLFLSGIQLITGWNIEFLIGWFTVSAWFAITNWYKYKRMTIYPDIQWKNFFISLLFSFFILIVVRIFFGIQIYSSLAAGFIVGYFYMIFNELGRKELEKEKNE